MKPSIPSWTNGIGASDLGIVWTDPDFDPKLRAFHYARVVEIPTPRWTACDRFKFRLGLPPDIPLKIQERTYIPHRFYVPPSPAFKGAKRRLSDPTVEYLREIMI